MTTLPSCWRCFEVIAAEDSSVRAFGRDYHPRCFRCARCQNGFFSSYHRFNDDLACSNCIRHYLAHRIQNVKVVVVGEAEVGKSSLVAVFQKFDFVDDYNKTVISDENYIQTEVKATPINLRIFDTPGDKAYRSVTYAEFAGADVALLVYDSTRRETFDTVPTWVQVLRTANPNILTTLIGNKTLDVSDSVVSTEEGQTLTNKLELHGFYETSALTEVNVKEAFEESIQDVVKEWD
eukprot:TRINITY_DN3931_c0_g1_i4.p1 TRINITY_DN3931_c0_g1~~TRINITY_DN3931_c0_g1_i4.p1  ORF type:complete len:236 (+),score=43.13 TRINITY_DN3931_c0_g1_i4:82-789(+)